MAIAVLVFFFAIAIGILFLGGLMWFILRRKRKGAPRQFSNSSHYGSGATHTSLIDISDAPDLVYTDYSSGGSWESENQSQSESSYTESGYSSYDSGSSSSSDSGSSDSGSSSSD